MSDLISASARSFFEKGCGARALDMRINRPLCCVEVGSMGKIDGDTLIEAPERCAASVHQSSQSSEPKVTHLGSMVCITTSSSYQNEAVKIPLRNGFPLHASDRRSPIFSLLTEDGCRAGHAVMVRDAGLTVYFDRLAQSGHYFIRNDPSVGQA